MRTRIALAHVAEKERAAPPRRDQAALFGKGIVRGLDERQVRRFSSSKRSHQRQCRSATSVIFSSDTSWTRAAWSRISRSTYESQHLGDGRRDLVPTTPHFPGNRHDRHGSTSSGAPRRQPRWKERRRPPILHPAARQCRDPVPQDPGGIEDPSPAHRSAVDRLPRASRRTAQVVRGQVAQRALRPLHGDHVAGLTYSSHPMPGTSSVDRIR